jgi:hypothetical protein
MTTDEQYFRGLMQDLLNAVVIQAAEDYREYSVKLLLSPEDEGAANEKEEVIAFFLSRDFNFYTTASGKNILTRLEAEETEMTDLFTEFREKKAAMIECWKQFHAGKHADRLLLEELVLLARRIREIQAIPERAWKDLFVLKTREKTVMKKISQWRREYARKGKTGN